ncbi:hypothetical protein ACFL6M_00080 [Candidatus Eisenbacteria bacterium]|uniref:Uncharacterized protein n=1 Tax=Eiseniibacteriota bacterium TaxID=2212470 RepID=A0ABV6YI20_UNCEI
MTRNISCLFAAALLFLPSLVFAQDLESGCDCWQTEPGTQVRIPLLPEGFFGTKSGVPSDPIPPQTIAVRGEALPDSVILEYCPEAVIFETVWYDRHGSEVNADDKHRVTSQTEAVGVEPIDAIVCRLDDVTLPGIGTPVAVQIELVELSLHSIDPIEVVFPTQPSSYYHVTVTEDELANNQGQLTLIPTDDSPYDQGDMLMDNLSVGYTMTFIDSEEIRPPVEMEHLNIEFHDTPGAFGIGGPPMARTRVPALSPTMLAILALTLIAVASFILIRSRYRTKQA